LTGRLITTASASSDNYAGAIRISPSSSEQWGGISFPDTNAGTSSSNNFWFYGRGTAISDRTLTVHIPSYTDYGSTGTIPSWGVYRSGAVNLFRVWADGSVTAGGNQVLTAGNYNSYAPTLTGGGASGTWGINVTGNAGTATTLQTARNFSLNTIGTYSGAVSFNGSADVSLAAVGAYSNSGATFSTGVSLYGNSHGMVNSADGPIGGGGTWYRFFQSSYSDLGSNVWQTQIAQWGTTGSIAFRSREGGTLGASGWGAWYTLLTNGNFGSYAVPLTGGTMSGGLTTTSLALSNGFTISQGASNYASINSWVFIPNETGFYSGINGAHFLPNQQSSYGSWRIIGTRNTWNGISFDASDGAIQLMIGQSSNETGFHNNSYGWQFRWSNGTLFCHKNSYGGGTSATVLDSSNYGSYALPLSGGTVNGNITSTNTITAYYHDTYPGDGYGFRFWQSDNYKISMGVSAQYQYGTVTDYSIKMNMDSGSAGRGFTWGTLGNVPVAALNGTSGNFQIAGYMGLATTPSSLWSTSWKSIQMAGSASVAGAQFSVFRAAALSVNAAGTSTSSPLNQSYIEASRAGIFLIVPSSGTTSCTFYWRGATVGTAGAAITWNTPMILDSNGYLLVGYGGSNGAYNLQVNSQIFATSSTIATSDGRYKENVESLDGALDLVKALRPVQFNWKKHSIHNFDTNTTAVGFIAQEVQQVLADKPYLNSIVKRNDCVLEAEEKDEDENVIKEAVTEEFFGIAEGNLIALLTRAMQEQNEEVVDLRTRVATLEALVLNLTGK
jgi:hypothetical protein